jgi:hypothetical protein
VCTAAPKGPAGAVKTGFWRENFFQDEYDLWMGRIYFLDFQRIIPGIFHIVRSPGIFQKNEIL